MSLRRMDFHCESHGFFEGSEPIAAPVSQTMPCPECGIESAKVWLKAPSIGKIEGGEFVVDFPGGHTLTRDECERRISEKPGVPFANDPDYAERIYSNATIRAYKREHGEIPPRPEPTAGELKTLETELKKQAGV